MTATATATWTPVCRPEDIVEGGGIAALHQGRQIAVFKVDGAFFALSNIDPFSGAGVLSRGIVGDRQGVLKVASPLYKQSFALEDGRCLDDEAVVIAAFETRLGESGLLEVGAEKMPA